MTASQPPYEAMSRWRLTAAEAIALLDAKFPYASNAKIGRFVGVTGATIGSWRRNPYSVLHPAKSDAVRKAVAK